MSHVGKAALRLHKKEKESIHINSHELELNCGMDQNSHIFTIVTPLRDEAPCPEMLSFSYELNLLSTIQDSKKCCQPIE